MTKRIFLILLILLAGQVHSSENSTLSSPGVTGGSSGKGSTDNDLVIKGEKQALELSDLPLSEYQYDDLSFFTKHFEPEKELLNLLDNPDVLMGLDNNKIALDFN